ncbi:hypothetical protein HN358_01450 [Candidatus Uhrbacteria bacterium]|jgi:hypothetical protein|nr:hypothetical protein [Candidatus Uhrbacteria bacterium]MBT7717305.1 hypothetical protein [Candidatus Uhrbacteria bacterium]
MKASFQTLHVPNPLAVLRKAGYSPFVDPRTKNESFILRLTSGFYPRFHLYLKKSADKVTFDLHIDQKKPGYGGGHMHNAEYDSPVVEKELMRITGWVNWCIKNPK